MPKKVTTEHLAVMISHGFNGVDKRFDKVETRFGNVENRLGNIEHILSSDYKRRIEKLESEMNPVTP